MYIYLTQDIAERAIDQHVPSSERVMSALEESMRQGKHLVFASLDTLDYVYSKAKERYPTIAAVRAKYTPIGTLARAMVWHAVFVSGEPSRRDEANHVIYINENELPKLELIKETHVIGEHLKDVSFMKYILHYYQREHGLKRANCFYPLLGGGSSISAVYRHEVQEGHAFVLCITDGDIKYPGGPKGDTGKNVAKADKECGYPYQAYYYQMEQVMEMENLIPWHVIEAYAQSTKDPEILIRLSNLQKIMANDESDLNYFDYKEGISKSKAEDVKVLTYHQKVAGVIDANIVATMAADEMIWDAQKTRFVTEGIAKDEAEAEKIIKYIRKKSAYVEGICTKILERVLESFSSNLETITKEQLTPAQQIEYERIGELLCSWTCCYEPFLS